MDFDNPKVYGDSSITDGLVHDEKIEEDRQRRGDVSTMEEMTKMANSIISIIKWTNDCPGSKAPKLQGWKDANSQSESVDERKSW